MTENDLIRLSLAVCAILLLVEIYYIRTRKGVMVPRILWVIWAAVLTVLQILYIPDRAWEAAAVSTWLLFLAWYTYLKKRDIFGNPS